MRFRCDLGSKQLAFYDPLTSLEGVAIPHRGGDGANNGGIVDKQNTIAAFTSAARVLLQYQLPLYAETDITTTAGGELIVCHGSGTPRQRLVTTPEIPTRWEMSRMTLSEINESVRIGGELVPTLSEVLEAVPDMKFFVDPKSDGAAKMLVDYLKRNPAVLKRVCVGSFSEHRNQMFAEAMGDNRPAMTLALGGAAKLLYLLHRDDTDAIPGFMGQSYASSATALHYFRHMRRGEYLRRVQELGLPVFGHVWLPSSLTMEHALSLASCYDGVMANQTEIIAKAVASHNKGKQ